MKYKYFNERVIYLVSGREALSLSSDLIGVGFLRNIEEKLVYRQIFKN